MTNADLFIAGCDALHRAGFTQGQAKKIMALGFDAAMADLQTFHEASREAAMNTIRRVLTGKPPGVARGMLAAVMREIPTPLKVSFPKLRSGGEP